MKHKIHFYLKVQLILMIHIQKTYKENLLYLNICDILTTFMVLKFEKFIYFNDLQLENIPYILVILLVLQLEKSKLDIICS